MSYNITGIGQNTTGLLTFIQGVNNNLMFGWLGTLLLMAITVILFTSFMVTLGEVRRVVVATTFLSFIFALLLRMMSLIPNLVMFISLILAAGAIAFSFMTKDD